MAITIRHLLALAALSGLAALAACASISKDECRAGDWAGVGFADGANGREPSYIERHRKACAKVGVTPDVTTWLAARTKGLVEYCTPAKAYLVTRRGGAIAPYCSAAQLSEMAPAIERGRLYYDYERLIQAIRQDLWHIDRYYFALADIESGHRARLVNERFRLERRIFILESRQLRYASWPG